MSLAHPFSLFRNHINSLFDDFASDFIFNSLATRASLLDDEWTSPKQQLQERLYGNESPNQLTQPSTQTSNDQVFTRPFDLQRYFARPWLNTDTSLASFNWPAALQCSVNIVEDKDRYVVEADLPGVEKKDIEVNIDDGYMELRAERKSEVEESELRQKPKQDQIKGQQKTSSEQAYETTGTSKEDSKETAAATNKGTQEKDNGTAAPPPRWLRREVSYGVIERRLALPKDVDQKKVSAKYEGGVLKVILPRMEKKVQQNTIAIE